MPFLNIERDGAIWTLTMNQPETRNALTGNTAVEEFVQVCDEIRRDASVKAVILTGAGPIFSSGGNVKDMQRFFDDALTPDAIREEYRQGIQRIPRALTQLDVPVICAINGPAIGAGLDLTCMCDIRIASETATFAESFVRVGIVPGTAAPGCCRAPWAAPRRPRWHSRARPSMRRRPWPAAWSAASCPPTSCCPRRARWPTRSPPTLAP
jgi:enoyl-CoA hydratase/carnithine racemase